VVVGASAGGVESLATLVAALPADFGAAVLVVLHLASGSTSVLPQILSRSGELPAAHAEDGEPVQPGRIYVAPPDSHLRVEDGVVALSAGPKENGYRPAIDPLFRSAAADYGPRAVGIVLSGALDDGSAGLLAIRLAGGTALVQSPDDALYPSMPNSAIAYARPQHVLPVAELGQRVVEIVDGAVENGGRSMAQDPQIDDPAPGDAPTPPGDLSSFVCPECGGAIWVETESGLARYSCHVGHAYSEATFVAEQGAALEAALWTSVRALRDRAALAGRLSERMRSRGHERSANRYDLEARDALDQARVVDGVLAQLDPLAASDDAVAAEG
jgi:two-component system chemotaxis response regulator CheB